MRFPGRLCETDGFLAALAQIGSASPGIKWMKSITMQAAQSAAHGPIEVELLMDGWFLSWF